MEGLAIGGLAVLHLGTEVIVTALDLPFEADWRYSTAGFAVRRSAASELLTYCLLFVVLLFFL